MQKQDWKLERSARKAGSFQACLGTARGGRKASRDMAVGMMLERPWGSLPKGGLPMLHFLRDVLVAFVAGVLVAVVAHVMGI